MTKKTNNRRAKRLKDKELRNKFLADQIKIGLRYQLRSLRDSQGLTQKDLANLIGTKQSVISRLERNAQRVSIPTLLDIAEALDVGVVVRFESIDTVIDWYSNPTQKKMTPRKSEEILKELLEHKISQDKILGKEISEKTALDGEISQTGQLEVIAINKTGEKVLYEDKDNELKSVIYSDKKASKIKIEKTDKIKKHFEKQNYIPPMLDYTKGIALIN